MARSSNFTHPPNSVLFCDFDGPIVNVSDRYYHTYKLGLRMIRSAYAAEQGRTIDLTPLSKQQFWSMKQNRVCDRTIAARSGLPQELIDTFLQQVCRIVNHPHLLRWDALQFGADKAIAQVKRGSIRLVLVTLRHPRQVQSFLQAHDLSQYVDQIFGASDIHAAHANRTEQKVTLLERAIAEQVAQGHSIAASWMVGDTEADIIAGQTAGLSTMALTCGVRSQTYLKQFKPSEFQPNLLAGVSRVRQCLLQAA
ncbi:MAG: HAD hydrolase-like protein [Cyanobacteria bacterium J06628_6]